MRDATATLESTIRDWPGKAVVCGYDAASEAWIFIALHDDTLGHPVGGTRLRIYDRPVDGLRDGLRLAEGMTHKWAALGLDSGGGKAVLCLSRELSREERTGLLRRYAAVMNGLAGGFSTGRDLGTTDEDMLTLSEVTAWVHGVDRARRTASDPGPYTARGVHAAVRATLEHAGLAGSAGATVLIQGLGGVGAPLARRLAASGARLLLSDADTAVADRMAQELGAEVVPPDAVLDTPCDLFAPCAIGAILSSETISRLRCRAVAGSANNQLAETADADRLHRRGILYAPDYIANGGGAMAFGLMHRGLTDEDEIGRRLDGIGESLARLFEEAAERDESPLSASQRRVRRTLTRAASGRVG
ncbi:MAG: amino acid dehydrogenase [bacterium]|nr:amino acid dehydrogenase [bacterium]